MPLPRPPTRRRRSLLLSLQAAAIAAVLAALALQWRYTGSVPHDLASAGLKKALVLTAHPDDEVMFFAPAILQLIAAGVEVYGLCMSSGNADGLGETRARELVRSYAVLGVPESRVSLIDDPLLLDGMDTAWNPAYIATKTAAYVVAHDIDTILTFDALGVSSHPNHIALHIAASRYLLRGLDYARRGHDNTNVNADAGATDKPKATPTVYALQTPPLWAKYLCVSMALRSHTQARQAADLRPQAALKHPERLAFLSSPVQYLQALRAMRAHASQLLWFRYLYVLFSVLMYGAQLERIQVMG